MCGVWSRVEGPRPRGIPKRTSKEVVKKDCQARRLNKEDAMDHSRWRNLIKDVRWLGWVWVGECFFWYQPAWVVPEQMLLTVLCVCVCVCNRCGSACQYYCIFSSCLLLCVVQASCHCGFVIDANMVGQAKIICPNCDRAMCQLCKKVVMPLF